MARLRSALTHLLLAASIVAAMSVAHAAWKLSTLADAIRVYYLGE